MGLTRSVLKRPVTTVLAVLCLIVFGISSIFSSKLELTPEMEMPMVVVFTVYPGANPEDVDELVTKPIEDEIGTLNGIKSVNSYSNENMSMVLLQYEYGTDIDVYKRQAPDSAGSQFFIMHEDSPHLDGAYAAFGKVTEGLDVVDKIAAMRTDWNDRPMKEQKIKKMTAETFGTEYPEPEKC